jgi:hypothetical protein
VVIVVSEETAVVSVADRGRLYRNLTPPELRNMLSGRSPARESADALGVPA